MSAKALTLKLLRDAGERGVTTADFLNAGVGSRYGARICELRKEGHPITSEPVRKGSYRYRLDFEGGSRPGSPSPASTEVVASLSTAAPGTGDQESLFPVPAEPHWKAA